MLFSNTLVQQYGILVSSLADEKSSDQPFLAAEHSVLNATDDQKLLSLLSHVALTQILYWVFILRFDRAMFLVVIAIRFEADTVSGFISLLVDKIYSQDDADDSKVASAEFDVMFEIASFDIGIHEGAGDTSISSTT